MTNTIAPTDARIKQVADDVAWMVGQGGFRVYKRDDLSGGEWYADNARPAIGPDQVIFSAPRSGVAGSPHLIRQAEDTIRRALAPHTECSYCEGTGLGPDGAECELCAGYGYTVPALGR